MVSEKSRQYNITIADILNDEIPPGIKLMTCYIYNIKENGGNYEPVLASKETQKYAVEGNNLVCCHYDETGEMVSKDVLIGNEEAKTIEKHTFSMPGGALFSKHIFKYDNHGNLVKDINYLNDGVHVNTAQYSYDDEGRLTQRQACDADGISQQIIRIYDASGLLTGEDYYEDDVLQEKKLLKYDINNKTVETVTYENGRENWSERHVSLYDSNDKEIEKLCYNASDGLYLKTTYKYDVFGNLTEEINYTIINESGITKEVPFHKYVNEYEYLEKE
ncbi:MAG: hypothetical protein HY811_04165 [Planctomycetes bacterium]|nr:hypothetical protein [Planctomycetota bacterium]